MKNLLICLSALMVSAAGAMTITEVDVNGTKVRMFEEMVAMKDGVKLYTVGALPSDGAKVSICWERNPYVKEERANLQQLAAQATGYLNKGYTKIWQHCRGCGMSEGDWIQYDNERADGLAALEWLRTLPFYNGNIFVNGLSYLASVHWLYLDAQPADVKAAVLNVQDCNRYNILYRNGCFKSALHGNWYVGGYKKKDKSLKRDAKVGWDLLPLKDYSLKRLGERVPHLDNAFAHPRPEDAYWQTPEGGSESRRALLGSTIPVLMRTGWYDIYTEGIFDMWHEMPKERRANCCLIVDAFDHGGARPKDRTKDSPCYFPNGTRHDNQIPLLDWCTNSAHAAAKHGKILYYTLWRNDWHECEEFTDGPNMLRFNLCADRSLRTAVNSNSDAATTLVYNPTNAPTFPGSGCLFFGGMQAQPEPNFHSGVISYTSAPFKKDTCVRGRMRITLNVNCNCDDTTYFVRVSVKKSDGKWWTLRDDIKPLCWDAPYKLGSRASVTMRMGDHSFLLQRGDVLRVDVAGNAQGAFVAHTNFKGPFAEQTQRRVATSSIFETSFIELPCE